MKKILVLTILFFSVNQLKAQGCLITPYALQDTLNCGDTLFVNFNAFASAALQEAFTATGPSDPGWATTSGAQYDNPYIPSPSNDTYFWMGPSAAVPTSLTTVPFNVAGGGQICFDFVYAGQGGSQPIEQPDQYDEGISLQYNDGSGWVDIIYYPPVGGTLPSNPNVTAPNTSTLPGNVGPYEVWTSVCIPIPPGAQGPNTSFQWLQENNSGACCDHWGLDNIEILVADTNFEIVSLNDNVNLGPAPVTYSTFVTTDTTFDFMYSNFFSDTCYGNVTTYMNPTDIGPDLILDCNQNVVQLEALGVSPNDNFSWSPITGLSDPNVLNPTASPLDTTEYIFNSSCGADTMILNVVANYSFSTSNDTTICVGDAAFLEVFGGAENFAWTPNDGSINDTTLRNPTFTPTNTTTYYVETDSAGCIKNDTLTIFVSNKQWALILPPTDADCNGNNNGSLFSVANGGLNTPYDYQLSLNSTIITNQTTGIFNSLGAGDYTITVNDSMAACPIDTTLTVGGGINVNIDSIYFENPLCVGDTGGRIEIYIDTNVVANYSLNGGPTQSSNIFTGLTDNTYNISVQFGSCPPALDTVILSAPATIDILFEDSIDLTCFGAADGQIHVSANMGVQPYQYSLDNIFFQTDSFFTGLNAGSYAIYAMDDNGCRDSLVTSISEPAAMLLNNININDVVCNGDSSGSISFNVINGITPYQYSIDSGLTYQSLNTFNNLAQGAYVLQATDTNGCFSNLIHDTINEPSLVVLIEDSTNSSTCGAADGSIFVSASGGTNTFTYSIDTGATFQASGIFNGLTAGLYNILVNDANGCSSNLDVSIANFGAPTLTIASFDSINCFGGSNAEVQLSAIGGSAPYQFSVDGGALQNDSLFNNLTGGVHNFIVEDAIGCQGTVSITIYEPAILNLSATQDSTSCFGTNDGEINLVATGGTAPFVFAVEDTSMLQLNSNFNGFEAGTYMTYVADANGCIDSISQVVLQADTIIITNILADSVNCFNAADGQISFNATGGVTAYTYSINGGTSFLPTNTFIVDTGNFNLVIEDAQGCQSDVYNTSVFQPTDLELDSINTVVTNCGLANGSLEVLASGGIAPYSYSLNGGTSQASGLFNNVTAMNHTVIVTDANSCTETINIFVDSIPNLGLSVMSFDSVSCGGAADATVTVLVNGGQGPYSYTVNGGVAQASSTFTGLSGGNNVFVVSDAIGNCTATVTENIYEPVTLTLSATQVSASCNSFADGQIILTASGGGTNYLYALNDTSTVQVSNIFTGLMAGIDTAYVVDENGCFASVIQTVLEPDTLIIINVNPVDISCNASGSFTVDAQGGTMPYFYNIDGGATQSSNVFTITAGGTYTLGVTDANGCPTAIMVDSITAPDPVTFVVDSSTVSLVCNNQNDGFIGVNASGGSAPYTYSINGGAFQVDSFFTNLGAGTYSIVVQDVFMCLAPAVSVNIIQPAALSGNSSSTGVSCNGITDGVVTINLISGGTAPYTVEVDGLSSPYTPGLNFANLAAGTYLVNVTDANNCTFTWNETVADVAAIALNASAPINVSCFGAADGEISVSATGGTPNYDFTITLGAFTETINSNSSATFSNLEGTETGLTYTISIQDVNGCSANLTQTITQPNQLAITGIDTSALSCFGADDASMTVNVSGGSAPYTYLWTPSDQTGSTASGLNPGIYSVAVTDANNCTVTASQTILDVAPVLATIIPDSALVSMGDDLQLGINVENALGTNLQYAWSPSEGLSCSDCENPVVTTYNDIAYSVIVTDENNCSSFNFTEVYVTVDGSLFYFIPNAFSPNGDGINDVFNVLGQDVQNVGLQIYNRWGEKVFDGSNQFITWDGTFKGEMQGPGVYSYVTVIKFLNDVEIVKKGSVTLIR